MVFIIGEGIKFIGVAGKTQSAEGLLALILVKSTTARPAPRSPHASPGDLQEERKAEVRHLLILAVVMIMRRRQSRHNFTRQIVVKMS